MAKAAQISLPAVRRMESGALTRLDEAVRVAAALNKAPGAVFPKAFKRLGRFTNGDELNRAAWNDRDFRAEMADAGIDIHPAEWTLKLRLDGGAELFFGIAATDLDRFWHVVSAEAGDHLEFFHFDSDDVCVAVNTGRLVHAHAMFDPPGRNRTSKDEPQTIEVFMSRERKPLKFDADIDEPDTIEDGGEAGQLRDFLECLDMMPEARKFVSFEDVDGERAVFRTDALALVTVPQWLLWGQDDEPDDEPERPPRRRPQRPRLKLLPGGR